MTVSSGNAIPSTRQMTAWLPKSATVTGLLSLLSRTSGFRAALTVRHNRAAWRTAWMASDCSRS